MTPIRIDNFLYYDVPQASDAWWEVRRGIPTASEFSRICPPVKPKKSFKGEQSYIAQLIADTMQQTPNYFTGQGTPANPHIEEGKQREAESRAWYSLHFDCDVQEGGFCTTLDSRFGCSPDGIMRSLRRGLELKNPRLDTHLKWLLSGELPNEHKVQVHGGMAVTGWDEWAFVSYCPPADPLHVLVKRDEFTARLQTELERFWKAYQEALLKCLPADPAEIR